METSPHKTMVILPETGFVRLAQVLKVFPISKSAWWQGIKSGIYPRGIKIGPRTTAWRVEDIRRLIKEIEGEFFD